MDALRKWRETWVLHCAFCIIISSADRAIFFFFKKSCLCPKLFCCLNQLTVIWQTLFCGTTLVSLLSNQHGQGEQQRCKELTHWSLHRTKLTFLSIWFDHVLRSKLVHYLKRSCLGLFDCLLPVLKPHYNRVTRYGVVRSTSILTSLKIVTVRCHYFNL